MRWLLTAVCVLVAVGCGKTEPSPDSDGSGRDAGADMTSATDAAFRGDQADSATPDAADGWNPDDYVRTSELGAVPEYEQREGDPYRGYDILVNEGYVNCGVPSRLYDEFFGGGEVPESSKLPGRRNGNEDLPFNQTRFERDGIELVSTNCLACHANYLPTGELVVGLGYEGDYTTNLGRLAELGRQLVDEENEREVEEYERWMERVTTTQPYIKTSTIGVNPADNLAGVLTAHRDPDTWEWLEEPWFELPEEVEPIPLSVPPWWHTSKKNALYYTSIGRGDHARFIMAAALLCTDTEEEAREIDEWFVHVLAYIDSLEAPEYPYAIDDELAAQGEPIFEENCSRCHGTYGAEETYPNLVIGLDEVQTDPVLAREGLLSAKDAVAWLNRSFFGEVATAAPAEGYVAPPLDGIWATAPYLHNASVPTLAAVLDSSSRPTYWTRDFQSRAYDREAVGLVHESLAYGKEGAENADEAKSIYDTTLPGYSNQGHTFGDALTDEERRAVVEYLKTL
jgi:mono/diheme cytochrome c family protein